MGSMYINEAVAINIALPVSRVNQIVIAKNVMVDPNRENNCPVQKKR
jgi:hypothetical protein